MLILPMKFIILVISVVKNFSLNFISQFVQFVSTRLRLEFLDMVHCMEWYCVFTLRRGEPAGGQVKLWLQGSRAVKVPLVYLAAAIVADPLIKDSSNFKLNFKIRMKTFNGFNTKEVKFLVEYDFLFLHEEQIELLLFNKIKSEIDLNCNDDSYYLDYLTVEIYGYN